MMQLLFSMLARMEASIQEMKVDREQLKKDNKELKERIAELSSDQSTRSYATTVRSGTTRKSVSWSDLSPPSIDSRASRTSSIRRNTSDITLDFSHAKEVIRMEEVGNIRKKLGSQAIELLKEVGIKNLRTWPHSDNLGIMKFEVPVELKSKVRNTAG